MCSKMTRRGRHNKVLTMVTSSKPMLSGPL